MKLLERVKTALENGETVSNADGWALLYRITDLEALVKYAQSHDRKLPEVDKRLAVDLEDD